MQAHGGPPPAVPYGWHTSYSDEHHQWYYVNQSTGASQWEPPSAPPPTNHPGVDAHPAYGSDQPQHPQQSLPTPPADTGNANLEGERGLGEKGKTALAAGGGMIAGAYLQHEITEFTEKPIFNHHGGHHHHLLDSVAGLMGSAGAGALAGKLFGKKTQTSQVATWNSPPAPHAPAPYAPAPYTGMPPPQAYPNQGHTPPPHNQGYGPSWGNHAAVGAGMTAATMAHNAPPSYQQQPQYQGATPLAGSVGVGAPFVGPKHMGPPLTIHRAMFADKDVTEKVRTLVTPEQGLSIEKLTDVFGDPWPEAPRKMFNVLYQYGERPLEVWAGDNTESGPVIVRNEPLSNERMSFVNKGAGRIICLIWGSQSVLSDERIRKLEEDGEADCKDLGNGGFWGWEPRNLICYYRGPNGSVEIGHAREGGTMRLPWNALAKWS